MRHSKSRFIEDARRVGTGAVRNRTYRGCASVSLFLDFTILRHSQCTANPLNPSPDFIPDTSGQAGGATYQGDLEKLRKGLSYWQMSVYFSNSP